MTIARPDNLSAYWANGASTTYVNDIPVNAPTDPQLASFELGFPPITMTPKASDGLPPYGQDMNGILKVLSEHTRFQNSGGVYRFDSALATILGGYDSGTVLQSNDGLRQYVSGVNANMDDFNADPSSIGVTWFPHNARSIRSDLDRSWIVIPTTDENTQVVNGMLIQWGIGTTDGTGEANIFYPIVYPATPSFIGAIDRASGGDPTQVNLISVSSLSDMTSARFVAKKTDNTPVATGFYWLSIGKTSAT